MKHNYGSIFPQLFPSLTWRKKNEAVHLTFDDGPIPEVTEWVLDLLSEEKIKATFFCVGDNIRKYPELYQRLIDEGHSTGNHTFNHLNGRKVSSEEYFENIDKSEKYMNVRDRARLFRPPYGKLRYSQIRELKKKYEVIMWDVLSGDFSQTLAPEDCLKAALRYTKKGSIVVFHDNVKSYQTLQYVLPRYIKAIKEKGLSFSAL